MIRLNAFYDPDDKLWVASVVSGLPTDATYVVMTTGADRDALLVNIEEALEAALGVKYTPFGVFYAPTAEEMGLEVAA